MKVHVYTLLMALCTIFFDPQQLTAKAHQENKLVQSDAQNIPVVQQVDNDEDIDAAIDEIEFPDNTEEEQPAQAIHLSLHNDPKYLSDEQKKKSLINS